jgi:nucleotide-binding universal stress UspA family protein
MKSVTSMRHSSSQSRPPSSLAARDTTSLENDASLSRRAGIKQVLVCVDGTDKDRAVLDLALQIALRFGSHVDVLHVRFDVHGITANKGHEDLVDRLLAEPVENTVAEAAARARRHFEEWHAQCKLQLHDSGTAVKGPSSLWREIIGYENEVIARLGRVSDLIVVARAGERSSSSLAMALETALFDTSRPVLMVPDGTHANPFHRPLIAWNGSREAARAIGFALPFLSEFKGCVEIFAAPESKHHTDTEELVRYLGWHGIVADRVSADDARPIGMSLLAQASANQTGLIVMGAYTHGHYRQFLFGGMTRYVMEHAAIPILFAH